MWCCWQAGSGSLQKVLGIWYAGRVTGTGVIELLGDWGQAWSSVMRLARQRHNFDTLRDQCGMDERTMTRSSIPKFPGSDLNVVYTAHAGPHMSRTRTQCALARASRAVDSASKAKNRAQLLISLESELHRELERVRRLRVRGSRVVWGIRVFCARQSQNQVGEDPGGSHRARGRQPHSACACAASSLA